MIGVHRAIALAPPKHLGASGLRVCTKLHPRCLLVPAVFVTKVDPNYAQPWQMCIQRASTGSAFVTDSKRRLILTNSHVVGPRDAAVVGVGGAQPDPDKQLCGRTMGARGCSF